MDKRCRAFNSETRSAYVKHKASIRKPYSTKLYWGDENKIEVKLDKDAESYARKLQLDCYKSTYQKFYNSERFEEELNAEEADFGNELIEYLKKLYYTPPKVEMTRLPYTGTRIFGFSNPKCLITPFSDYQDGTGRTGGDVMIKNVKKIIRAKKNAKIHDRLRANLFRGTEWIKDFQFPNEN